MAAYQANGARLGWLLIPHQQTVEVWPASGDSQRYEGIAVVEAGSAPQRRRPDRATAASSSDRARACQPCRWGLSLSCF